MLTKEEKLSRRKSAKVEKELLYKKFPHACLIGSKVSVFLSGGEESYITIRNRGADKTYDDSDISINRSIYELGKFIGALVARYNHFVHEANCKTSTPIRKLKEIKS